jgi:hypothetical protein
LPLDQDDAAIELAPDARDLLLEPHGEVAQVVDGVARLHTRVPALDHVPVHPLDVELAVAEVRPRAVEDDVPVVEVRVGGEPVGHAGIL